MVARNFYAFDSEALFVDASSPSLTPGASIINNSDTPIGTIYQFDSSFTNAIIELDDTSGDPDTFEDDQTAGHQITDGGVLVADGTAVEAESLHFLQQIDDFGNPVGPLITVTVFSQGGVTSDVWGFSTDTPLVDGARYEKTGGSNAGSSQYNDFVACFTTGSRVLTDKGYQEIETLRVGDLVLTRDNALQPVRWIGSQRIGKRRLAHSPHLAPVRVAKDSFGPGVPDRDTYVSPQHRLLMSGQKCSAYFDNPEVLAAASFLTGMDGIETAQVDHVTYVHALFDQHEVIIADGLWSESFQPNFEDTTVQGKAVRNEMLEIFPELAEGNRPKFNAARQSLRRFEGELLVA